MGDWDLASAKPARLPDKPPRTLKKESGIYESGGNANYGEHVVEKSAFR